MNPTEGRSRRITHNTLILYASDAIGKMFTWLLLAYLTRHWTAVGTYGQYALAVNWISILAIFSDLGLNLLVVREAAHHPEKALYYLRYTIAIRTVFSLLFWAGVILVSFILGYEPILRIAIAVMGLRILLDAISGGYIALFQSQQMMGFYSLSNVLSSGIRLLGISAVVALGGGVIEACAIWILSSASVLGVLAWKGFRLGWKPDLTQVRFAEALSILRQSIPLAVFGSLQMLYYRVDSIILKSLSGNEAVGYYDLAAKVIFAILGLSQVFGTAIFPALSSVRDDRESFGRMSGRSLKLLFLLGLPVTVGGILLAQPLILLISGDKYLPSVPMFMVLILSVGFYFLSHVYVIALAIYNVVRLNIQFAVLFVLNVGLNFLLIPRIGAIGASWATVICEVLGLVLGFGLAASYMKGLQWSSLARPFLACLGASALMGAGIWWDPRLYWLALGPLVYGGGIYLFGGLAPEDRDSLRAIFRRRMA